MAWSPFLAPLVEEHGEAAVCAACLTVLEFPAVMVTLPGEAEEIRKWLSR